MINLFYDLHIHSCLSPCGSDDMTPYNIAGMAALKGLDVIAVTDHNSCKNCPAVLAAAKEYGILAVPGMEINTSEEVHAVCLFKSLEKAMEFDAYVYGRLLPVKNREDIFGKQEIYDCSDQICGHVENLLISSTDISFSGLWELVSTYDGVMFPAHIDLSLIHIWGIAVFTDYTYIAAHRQRRNFCKGIHGRRVRIRYKYHIAFFNRSEAVVGTVKSDAISKDILGKTCNRDCYMMPSSVDINHFEINHLNLVLFAHVTYINTCFHKDISFADCGKWLNIYKYYIIYCAKCIIPIDYNIIVCRNNRWKVGTRRKHK